MVRRTDSREEARQEYLREEARRERVNEQAREFFLTSFEEISKRARNEKLAAHPLFWVTTEYIWPPTFFRMYTQSDEQRYQVLAEANSYYADVLPHGRPIGKLYSGKSFPDAAMAILRHASKPSERSVRLRRSITRLRKKAVSLPGGTYVFVRWFLEMTERASDAGAIASPIAGTQQALVDALVAAVVDGVTPPNNREARGRAMAWLAKNSRFLVRVNRRHWVLKFD